MDGMGKVKSIWNKKKLMFPREESSTYIFFGGCDLDDDRCFFGAQ